ncbi:MAG TPA: hypothetical protein VF365_10575 [Candidatus Limnocylindria bacterium]
MLPRHRIRVAIIGLPLVIGLVACGAGTTVDVSLREFSIAPSVASVPAGTVTFEVTNDGPNDVHEFVVVRTDLAPDALPTDGDGAVLEDGEGMEVIDEIEDLAVGASETLALELEAGSYVLICNIVELEEGGTEAHYALGMRSAFTVGN